MNYHEKAVRDIKVATYYTSAVGNPDNDEGMYDIAAYHAQQGIEKEIKYILHDIFGADETEKRFRVHSIPSLISYVEEYGVVIPDEVKSIAYDVTEWEASSRYPGGAKTTRDEIQEAIGVFDELAQFVKEKVEAMDEIHSKDN